MPDHPHRDAPATSLRVLGHPVHPLFTDITIGLLHSATLLDVMPGDWARRAARVLLAWGMAFVGPTIATGLHDGRAIGEDARPTGTAHGATNATGAAMYGASLAARRRGHEGTGRLLSLAGYATMLVGGFLGRSLTYDHGAGVRSRSATSDDG